MIAIASIELISDVEKKKPKPVLKIGEFSQYVKEILTPSASPDQTSARNLNSQGSVREKDSAINLHPLVAMKY